MSHFVTIVLTQGTDPSEMLAPYSENLEVEPYDEECWCRESGSRHARELLDADGTTERHQAEVSRLRAELGALDDRISAVVGNEVDVRFAQVGEAVNVAVSAVGESPELAELAEQEAELAAAWFAAHDGWHARFDELAKSAPNYGKADVDCRSCRGTGTAQSTANPKGKWDWFQVGGRWTGFLDPDYEPDADPRNKQTCIICAGSGKRYWRHVPVHEPFPGLATDWRPTTSDDPLAEEKPCNGCDGIGVAKKWPTSWAEHHGDVQPIGKFAALLASSNDVVPFALITPDGEWHQRGEMLMFGVATDLTDRVDWADAVRSTVADLAENNPDLSAIVVDCHT